MTVPDPARAAGVQVTPESVARYMVEHSLGRRLRRDPGAAAGLRILDPACGPGVFLLLAFDCLLDWYRDGGGARSHGLAGPELGARIAKSHLFGIDIDGRAVGAARKALRERIGGNAAALEENIVCGDALAARTVPEFRGILDRGGFDVVLGNPPYVFGEHLDPAATAAYRERFELARQGQPDLYKLFFERSVGTFLADGGVHAFLVPDALLARDDHADVRRWLVHRMLPATVCHAGQVFRRRKSVRVGVSAVALISRRVGEERLRRLRSAARCEVHRWTKDGAKPVHATRVSRCFPGDGAPWTIHAPDAWYGSGGLREMLERHGTPLASILRPGPLGITRGEEIGKAVLGAIGGAGEPPAGRIPIYAGKDIRRHHVSAPVKHIDLGRVRKPQAFYAGPKILFVKTGAGPVAAATTDDLPALQSVYVLHLREDLPACVTPDAVVALLCGALVTAYCYYRWTSCKGLHPQLTIGNVGSIPLPQIRDGDASLYLELADGVQRIREAPERCDPDERSVDEAVARLYGLDLARIEAAIAPALNALPDSQRPRWWGGGGAGSD